LFARLDELEEKETANAELDQLGKDNSDEENKTETEFVKKEDDVRWAQPSTATDKDITKKKVKWEACVDKKDCSENDDSEEEEDDDDVETTIPVKFTSSSMSLQGQTPEKHSEEPAVITPADIYSQFTPKQELKSILRKPSVQEKDNQTSVDKIVTKQQALTDTANEKPEKKDFDPQKAFTGTIVEKPALPSEQQGSSMSQISTSQPEKKLSRFKAARQKR